jgi:elongation factor 1 alpha-like protein
MGRLLFDLKAIDDRTMNRYKTESEAMGKGSFAFAWIMDAGSDERERGVTIDIASHTFSTDKTDFTILDAPGHRDFVPNMIAGASQADFAVLVVDASTGEFEAGMRERGQTREHALLVRAMGAQRVVVAVNKMDVAEWDQARFEDIKGQLSSFLLEVGFKEKNLAFVPCAGLEGENILKKVADDRAKWWKGPTLVEELDKSEASTHAIEKPLRMTIDDVFRGSVQNPLSISGRISAGSLQVGDSVLFLPAKETAFIKGIEIDYQPRDWAVAGMNVTLHLSGIEEEKLRSGDSLCSVNDPIRMVKDFTVKVLAFKHLMPMPVDVHRGRMHVPGRIGQLIAVLDKSTMEVVKKKPKVVKPGQMVRIFLVLEGESSGGWPVDKGGRIVLRSGGETIAAGIVE